MHITITIDESQVAADTAAILLRLVLPYQRAFVGVLPVRTDHNGRLTIDVSQELLECPFGPWMRPAAHLATLELERMRLQLQQDGPLFDRPQPPRPPEPVNRGFRVVEIGGQSRGPADMDQEPDRT